MLINLEQGGKICLLRLSIISVLKEQLVIVRTLANVVFLELPSDARNNIQCR